MEGSLVDKLDMKAFADDDMVEIVVDIADNVVELEEEVEAGSLGKIVVGDIADKEIEVDKVDMGCVDFEEDIVNMEHGHLLDRLGIGVPCIVGSDLHSMDEVEGVASPFVMIQKCLECLQNLVVMRIVLLQSIQPNLLHFFFFLQIEE